ncbi:MAG TPA: murein biosynthesis integral membrane protein MurJ [Anaerolineae bacterium]|nr:murein biosynthesis integral membrane protein MurJ [Anaerolineae bacterium]HIQ04337.1 murein biosynthesis integral membrane protein MurJ [Anaerolineae bacterium]
MSDTTEQPLIAEAFPPQVLASDELPPESAPAEPVVGLARSASILALGNVASRVLGLVREVVITHLFGATGSVSAFRLAGRVPFMVYDLLVGGMLSAALVPVFSDYARPERRTQLWGAASAVCGLIAMALGIIVLLVEAFAPQIAWLLGGGFDPELQQLLVRMLRLIAPAILFFGLSGVATALLYALKRFTFPAFGAAVFNLGIVVAVPILAGRLEVYSLALGVVLGSIMQLLLLLPGLRDAHLVPQIDLHHPALRRIGRLYLPVALGLVVSQIQVAIDGNLASRTGDSSVAWMQNATTLIQFPHGLVSVAVSLAALPTLSQLAAAGDWDGYKRTLARGLRLVLMLIVPATVGLFVLAQPIVRLLFEHGEFTAYDTLWTARALRLYLLGLVFASVDWPLYYAFYARQNTLTPALVGVASVGIYLVVALSLLRPWGMQGLVLADSAKHAGHALITAILLRQAVGRLGGRGIASTGIQSLLVAAVMGAGTWIAANRLEAVLGTTGLPARLAVVGGAGATGLALYISGMAVLRVKELGLIWQAIQQRLQHP